MTTKKKKARGLKGLSGPNVERTTQKIPGDYLRGWCVAPYSHILTLQP